MKGTYMFKMNYLLFAAIVATIAMLSSGCSNTSSEPTPESQRASYMGNPAAMPQSMKNAIAAQESRAQQSAADQRTRDMAKQAPRTSQ
jgi:hypothetical protein